MTDGECCPWALCPRMEPRSNETEPKKLRIFLSEMRTTNRLLFLYSWSGTSSEMVKVLFNLVLVATKETPEHNLNLNW